mgnify:CR=1 FL=1
MSGSNTQLGVEVLTDIKDFTKKFDEMKSQLGALGQTTQKAGDDASAGLKGVQEEIKQVGTLLKSGLLIEGGKALTEVVTVPIISLGREMVLLADKFHQTEIAFTTMLGSADAAKALLSDLRAFAAATPFEFPDLVQAAKKMKALGFETEQIIPMLRTVGDAVAGLGGGSDLFGRIILALGQMQAKGKVSAEEMKQLAEAGIPAWQALASQIGVSVPEAMSMAKQGAIDAQTAIAAITQDMSTRFGGLMAEQSKTIQGTLANMRDTVGFLMTDIGQQLIETLKLRDLLGAVQEFTQGFLGWFKSLDDGTKKTILVLTGAFAAGGPILVVVGAFMAAMAVVTAPMLVTGAIITGIVAGVGLLIAHWTTLKTTATSIWTGIGDQINSWGIKINAAIDKAIFGTAEAFGRLKTKVVGYVSEMVASVREWIVGKLTSALEAVEAPIKQVEGWFNWLTDKVTRHSHVPEMVEDIEKHIGKLDAVLVAPARKAAISVENAFRGVELTVDDIFNTLTDRMAYFSGSAIQTVSSSIAGSIQGLNNWKQAGQQLLNSFLTTFINAALSMTASWVIAEATRTTATQAANTTIAASTAATSTGMTAVFSAAATTIKAMLLGLAQGVISIIGVVIGGITTVLDGISFVLSFALSAIADMIFAAAAAVQSIPIVGQILGAIMLGAGALVQAAAIALPALVSGVGAMLSAGVGALAGSLPAFAEGGAVFGPTLALVGEKASRGNPEYIGHANQLGLNGRGSQTVIIQLDGQELSRLLIEGMPRTLYVRQGVSL